MFVLFFFLRNVVSTVNLIGNWSSWLHVYIVRFIPTTVTACTINQRNFHQLDKESIPIHTLIYYSAGVRFTRTEWLLGFRMRGVLIVLMWYYDDRRVFDLYGG